MSESLENNANASTEKAPAENAAAPKSRAVPRKFQAAPKPPASKALLWLFILISSVIVLVIAVLTTHVATPPLEADTPQLGPEFTDSVNNNYTIRPPVNWHFEDPHDGANIFIKGPKEKNFPPIIIMTLDIKPGGLASYLREHKGRISFQDKSVKWISDPEHEMDESIDGCPATARLIYDCEIPLSELYPQYAKGGVDDEGKPLPDLVKVRTLQYIMEDRPRFYRVTCHVAAELFDKYLPRFEACARSFRRLPLPKRTPQIDGASVK